MRRPCPDGCAIWLWNMLSYIKGGMLVKDTWKQDPEANICPKRDDNGEWKRLHNEELRDLYHSPNVVRVIKSKLRWAGHVARMEDDRSAFRSLTGKPTGKSPLGRPRRSWEGNIIMVLATSQSSSYPMRGIGLTRLRIGIIGEPLWMRNWISGFHKPWS